MVFGIKKPNMDVMPPKGLNRPIVAKKEPEKIMVAMPDVFVPQVSAEVLGEYCAFPTVAISKMMPGKNFVFRFLSVLLVAIFTLSPLSPVLADELSGVETALAEQGGRAEPSDDLMSQDPSENGSAGETVPENAGEQNNNNEPAAEAADESVSQSADAVPVVDNEVPSAISQDVSIFSREITIIKDPGEDGEPRPYFYFAANTAEEAAGPVASSSVQDETAPEQSEADVQGVPDIQSEEEQGGEKEEPAVQEQTGPLPDNEANASEEEAAQDPQSGTNERQNNDIADIGGAVSADEQEDVLPASEAVHEEQNDPSDQKNEEPKDKEQNNALILEQQVSSEKRSYSIEEVEAIKNEIKQQADIVWQKIMSEKETQFETEKKESLARLAEEIKKEVATSQKEEEDRMNKEKECFRLTDNESYCVKKDPAGARTGEHSSDGDRRVYAKKDAQGDFEIFLRKGAVDHPLTSNRQDDLFPVLDIAGRGAVVWQSMILDTWQIFSSDPDSKEVSQVTDTGYNNMNPYIWGNTIVWQGWVNGNWEIFLSSSKGTRQITNNSYHDMFPKIADNYITWQAQVNGSWQVSLYDIASGAVSVITKADSKYENPRFSILWDARGDDGSLSTFAYDFISSEMISLGKTEKVPPIFPKPEKSPYHQNETTLPATASVKISSSSSDENGDNNNGGE